MRTEKGFTLIEVVASLVIVGIMAAIAGMGIVTGTRGYLQTKENAHIAQKGHVAMNRVHRELMELTGIIAVNTTDPHVIFDNPVGRLAFELAGGNLRLHQLSSAATDLSGSTGDILSDQVAVFTIDYFKGSQPWTFGEDLELLSAITVSLGLQRVEGSANAVTFTTTIQPRNTNNFGGMPPDTTEPPTLREYGCFVTTAAGPGSTNYRPGSFAGNFGYGWLALFLTAALAAAVRGGNRRRTRPGRARSALTGQSGNVLVGLLVTMLVFSALAAGMVSMTATSTTSQVASNNTSRAYYVAESGFRYAASQYLNALDGNGRYGSEDEKNVALETMHTQTYTIGGDGGQFQLEVYPHYLTVAGDHILNATVLQSKFSGGPPAGFSMPTLGSTAKLSINGNLYTYFTYDSGTGIFNSLSPGLLEPVYSDAVIRPVGLPSTTTTMTNNGTLSLAYGFFFPEISGKFRIDGVTYAYRERIGNVLHDITDANDPSRSFSISVTPSTDVIVEPFLQVRTTGIVGQGDLTATREIVYNTPLPGDPENAIKVEYYDPFDDAQNMASATYGSFAAGDVGGDSALKVTGLSSTSLSPKAALVGSNSTKLNVNFASAHRFGGQFLTYDAQAKIGLDEPLVAESWTDGNEEGNAPDGFPKYFSAGIAFRMDQNLNMYGIGLLRGSNNWSPTPDNIVTELIPQDQVPMVALWQQNSNGSNRDWLAYSVLPGSIIFADDGESGNVGWTVNTAGSDGLEWELATNRAFSGSVSWTTSPAGSYGGYAGAYVDGDNITLTSPQIDLSTFDSAVLTFWTWYRIFSFDDYGIVQISTNGTAGPWTQLDSYTSNSHDLSGDINGWVKIAIDISSYTGGGNTDVRIRFLFDRNNEADDTRNGWWIDDVRITTKEILDLPLDYATLMVRVIEAAVIDFTSGGTTEIEAGDLVTQSGGVYGRVIFDPIVQSGTWAGGNAAGMILVNRTSSVPFTGGAIDVAGKGSDLATATFYNPRANLIKAYINSASTIDTGPPNDNGYDLLRLANPRATLEWPADESQPTTASNDYFTLLEWDIDINYSIPTIARLMDENGKYTILLSDDPDLFTPPDTYFPFNRPELGLFALGHGGIRAYFDDLGVQLYMTTGAGFLTPIQQ